ncbi:transposase [Streptomyces sp. SYSU K21746]
MVVFPFILFNAVDDLWERTTPLLPARPLRRHRFHGRKPVDDRLALRGIVYVLCKGVSWRDVSAERIDCSGATCWRRLRDWTDAGVWPRLTPGTADRTAKSRPAGRPGGKHHLVVAKHGHLLAVSPTGVNRYDITLIPLLDGMASLNSPTASSA